LASSTPYLRSWAAATIPIERKTAFAKRYRASEVRTPMVAERSPETVGLWYTSVNWTARTKTVIIRRTPEKISMRAMFLLYYGSPFICFLKLYINILFFF
jgi:hypothetical protein